MCELAKSICFGRMRNFRGFLLREGEFVSDSELSGHATGSDDGNGDSSDDDMLLFLRKAYLYCINSMFN